MAEVEETLKRIHGQKGVQGIIIVNAEVGGDLRYFSSLMTKQLMRKRNTLPISNPIKTTLDNSSTVQYAGLIHQLVMKARSHREGHRPSERPHHSQDPLQEERDHDRSR
ncbi:hypothetical protein SKAU_G00151780 [Synaphobranchus kaupii]|uniref:Uncharacterized protein n=1 Tax=Synaphobranchus kaupii TaxID=118154 RepID=A0A9Q1IYH3_SYNKA|nr:hypothetical protein SKAU_G00151780 [Synaphobranchus kaupii]